METYCKKESIMKKMAKEIRMILNLGWMKVSLIS